MFKTIFLSLLLASSLCFAKSTTKKKKSSKTSVSKKRKKRKKRRKRIKKKKPQKFIEYKRAKTVFGNLTEFVGDVQTDDQGNTNSLDFRPIFGVGVDVKTQYWFDASAEVLMTIPEEMGSSSGVKKQLFLVRLDLQKEVIPKTTVKLGSTWYITYIYGDGGTHSLGNGGTTTAFPKPASSTFSHNFTLDGALEFQISKDWAAKGQVLLYNIHDQERFAWSYIFGATYYWDAKAYF